ncbi:MAG TPA: class I SAM-dependent methyltransferase [Saprospiraceae bacterium]|jgi:SAM-dependent methyltransferase|nr:class I SAM-dependent methyltransferase [Saprospiraceae bacterium]
MNKSIADEFISPFSGENLTLVEYVVDHDQILEGSLISYKDDIKFPITNFIPRFVPKDNYANNFGFQWNKHRKTQLDSYAGITLSGKRVEEVIGNRIQSLDNQRILEAGSGAGRFTEIFKISNCTLYSFDYSSAVDANLKNNGFDFNLFQASIYDIPFRKETFDSVFCLGVIQHTPDPEKTFRCLSDQVKPGGKLFVDIYETRKYSMYTWKYLLRPIFKLFPQNFQYNLVVVLVSIFLPFSTILGKILGNVGHKLFPIANFFIVPFKSYKERWVWSILDTFDWYSPAYDLPQTQESLKSWYKAAGYKNIEVFRGSNGIIGRGEKN